MPYEIQSKLREEKSVIEGVQSNWRVEFIDMDLDPDKAAHIAVQFTGPKINKGYGDQLVANILEALNKEG
jgi:hypothetical protein